MKIALLFTGRSNNYKQVAEYLGKVFNFSFDTVDIFAHDWNDDFRRMINIDKVSHGTKPTTDFVTAYLIPKRNNNVLSITQQCFNNTIKYSSTSQKEIIDLAVEKSNQLYYNRKVTTREFLFYIMSIAQLASYNYALELWKDHVTETGERYDAVIRWRYDLLIPHANIETREAICKLKDNDVLFPDVDRKKQMLCDYTWAMNHDTAFNQGSKIYTEFKKVLDERFTSKPGGKGPHYNATENMLLSAIDSTALNPIVTDQMGLFSPVIWRTGCQKPFIDITRNSEGSVTHINDNVYDIAAEAEQTWINTGWNSRINTINNSSKKSDF